MSEACRDCRFWNRALRASWQDYDGKKSYMIEHAQCRRYAPSRLVGDKSPAPGKAWPHVNANDWCGEFQAARRREGSE